MLNPCVADTMQEDAERMAQNGLLPGIEQVILETANALLDARKPDGHWLFPLEADVTISAEYILLRHFLGESDEEGIEERIARYIRRTQNEEGGWSLFYRGASDPSATIKAYYALKLVGDDPASPHMEKARSCLVARGGARHANVFTRITMALFAQVPWRAIPSMPIIIMLIPGFLSLFHLKRISYWARTVIVPLLILMALRPRAQNPRNVDIAELFVEQPEFVTNWLSNPTGKIWGRFFLFLDPFLRLLEFLTPEPVRMLAVERAVKFIEERQNGENGLGGIFPAMANTVMAYHVLDYEQTDPRYQTARQAIETLLIHKEDASWCQPCLSPVWDTGLAICALLEAAPPESTQPIQQSMDWLASRQILDIRGDWCFGAPKARPGGWAFQYRNDHYPDIDDTALIAMILNRSGEPRYHEAVARAVEWICAMQSSNGGWGAFDVDNVFAILNHIPFADHGALLDPPTSDVTARCLSLLGQLGLPPDHPAMKHGLDFLLRNQEQDGSWYGRWGTNYIYGSWSALCALNVLGEAAPRDDAIRRGAAFLFEAQNEDGGWGENGSSYAANHYHMSPSTPSQTSWALLGLMAAGQVRSEPVKRGVQFLLDHPREDGCHWPEPWYTAVGFPRVFYLRYHGYCRYFPLWALARYRNLLHANHRTPVWGI